MTQEKYEKRWKKCGYTSKQSEPERFISPESHIQPVLASKENNPALLHTYNKKGETPYPAYSCKNNYFYEILMHYFAQNPPRSQKISI
ncbi:MAG TPA: hypothetical protein VJ863_03405 [Sphaerochaeta sp.]|nr:hypothetical protein [Sphaerochaeta sp.]